jgi:hypothetical protein
MSLVTLTRLHMQRTILLATFGGVTVLALSWAGHRKLAVEEIEPVVVEVGENSYEYVRAEESDAEIVFVVDITRPGDTIPTSHRFPLKRNPGAPNRGVGGVAYSFHGCGPASCFGRSIDMCGYDEKTNTLSLSVHAYWMTPDGRSGEADGKFMVPWLGEARQAISNGVVVHAHFVPPIR